MADEFTQEEKLFNLDSSKNKRGKYGCDCCRLYADLKRHRKFSRKAAKAKFRQKTRKIQKEYQDY